MRILVPRKGKLFRTRRWSPDCPGIRKGEKRTVTNQGQLLTSSLTKSAKETSPVVRSKTAHGEILEDTLYAICLQSRTEILIHKHFPQGVSEPFSIVRRHQ